jgi:hypothetical protein
MRAGLTWINLSIDTLTQGCLQMQEHSSDRFLVISQIIKQKQQNNHNNFGKKYWLKPPWQGFKSNYTNIAVQLYHTLNRQID